MYSHRLTDNSLVHLCVSKVIKSITSSATEVVMVKSYTNTNRD